MRGEHLPRVRYRYGVFELDVPDAFPLGLYHQGGAVIPYAHTHLALGRVADQAVPQMLVSHGMGTPTAVGDQELSLYFDEHGCGHLTKATHVAMPPARPN